MKRFRNDSHAADNGHHGIRSWSPTVRAQPKVRPIFLCMFSMRVLLVPLSVSLLVTACGAGDPDKGKKVFRKCRACHDVGLRAKNKVGPVLDGIVGRKAGTVAGYKYSQANKEAGEDGWVWTEKALLEYLENPKKSMPGTKMVFGGLKIQANREDVVAYLATFATVGSSPQKAAKANTKKADEEKAAARKVPAKPASEPKAKKTAKAKTKSPSAKTVAVPSSPVAEAQKSASAPSKAAKKASAGVSPPEGWVAGEAPSIRPPWAPTIKQFKKGAAWYDTALTGLSEPYPSSFRFLDDQGGWYTPFIHPGMTAPYDLRNWHAK
jgi:cytochrome c